MHTGKAGHLVFQAEVMHPVDQHHQFMVQTVEPILAGVQEAVAAVAAVELFRPDQPVVAAEMVAEWFSLSVQTI